jgi:hypothetical protein
MLRICAEHRRTPAVARAQSPGRGFEPRQRGLRLAGRLDLPIVGGIVPWWPALGIYFAGCGNLWSYRSLSQKLCWRFEAALAGLGPGAIRTRVSGRPLPTLTIEGQSRRL